MIKANVAKRNWGLRRRLAVSISMTERNMKPATAGQLFRCGGWGYFAIAAAPAAVVVTVMVEAVVVGVPVAVIDEGLN
jgi:hypothetical protein